jgi:ABC-type multidrug transport system ATPase subunit
VAVDRVSFGVENGQVFGLLGINGAGKTTTFKMLCGEFPPSDGKVTVGGFDISTQME